MKATTAQLTKLALAFDDHGVGRKQRADRLWLCSDHAGRPLTSSSELTKDEAHTLIERLEKLPRGSLQRILDARPAPAPTATVLLCTRGTPSAADRQVIEAFGAELEARAEKTRKVVPLMANGEPNPTGAGRYCPPAICWCGGPGPDPLPGACAWWQPLPPSGLPQVPKASSQQRASWANRSEATWIDAL